MAELRVHLALRKNPAADAPLLVSPECGELDRVNFEQEGGATRDVHEGSCQCNRPGPAREVASRVVSRHEKRGVGRVGRVGGARKSRGG